MQANLNYPMISVVLILMAIASLVTMVSLNQISHIVHSDLYNFGLEFSQRWAMPFWLFSGIIFALCWINIGLSISFTLYISRRSRKNALSFQRTSQRDEASSKEEENLQRPSESFGLHKTESSLMQQEMTKTPREAYAGESISEPDKVVETAIVHAPTTRVLEKDKQPLD